MALKRSKVKQIRPAHMSLEQLKKLLARRLLGVSYVKFLMYDKYKFDSDNMEAK